MPDRDWIVIIILGIGWGTTFFFNEVLLREMGPVTISFARVVTAALFCGIWAALAGHRPWRRTGQLGPIAFFGIVMFALPLAIYPIGQQFVASGVAGIVNALTPVMVVIVSHFWPDGERATLLKSLGVGAGLLGIVLLTLPALADDSSARLFGTLFLVLAPICYAVAMNYFRRLHGLTLTVMLTWAFGFAAAFLLPLVLVLEGVPEALSPETWASIAIIGIVLTGLSFIAAFTILPRAGATKTSTVTFIAPISALLIGYCVLNGDLGPLHLAGMAAIFLGLLLIDGRLFGPGRRRAAVEDGR